MLRPAVMKRTQTIPCLGFPAHLNLHGAEFPSLVFPSCPASPLSFSAVLAEVVLYYQEGPLSLFHDDGRESSVRGNLEEV